MSNPPQPDRHEILRAIRRIAAPDQVVELRALNVSAGASRRPITLSGYYDDFERLAADAARIRGAQGVYVTLNPPNPAVLARCANRLRQPGASGATSDRDIIARRWLPIDLDPQRPAEISASDAEHEAALEAARRVRDALAGLGWPAPILADSGNGGHLLYRVDLDLTGLVDADLAGLPAPAGRGRPARSNSISPNPQIPANSSDLIERILAALAARFDDDRVHVDVKVFNPARIWKLYGTVARKGDHTPERPHRLACILEAPEEPVAVARELLEAMAEGQRSGGRPSVLGEEAQGSRGAGGQRAPKSTWGGGAGVSTVNRQSSIVNPQSFLDRWLADHNVPVDGPHAWRGGGRRWVFPSCPWDPAHAGSAFIVELPNGAIGAGCHHNSCAGKGWHDLRAIYDCGLRIADSNAPRPQASTSAASETANCQSAINNPQSAILSWPEVTDRAGRAEAEERATGLIEACAGLDRTGLLQVTAALRGRGLGAGFITRWLAAVREVRRRRRPAGDAALPDEYLAEEGRTYRLSWGISAAGELQAHRAVVADFALQIVEEIVAEDGRVRFTLAGEAADGRPLRLELRAADFADERALQEAVTAAAGPRCPVRANMLRHLRPAIQLLTLEDPPQVRRFERTGWADIRLTIDDLRLTNGDLRLDAAASRGAQADDLQMGEDAAPPPGLRAPAGSLLDQPQAGVAPDQAAGQGPGDPPPSESSPGDQPPSTDRQSSIVNPQSDPANRQSSIVNRKFLLPGRELPGVVIALPGKLAYRVEAGRDLAQGLIALEAALSAANPRRTTVLVAAMLGAPMARLAGLQGERYGVFISGRTGSLKTSTAQALMCIYGAGFLEDANLLKLGEGATRNALMAYAAPVHDLPLLLDNYKPSTGDGSRGFVNLLHNLLEGGDRERLTRNAELRESRPLHCWPIFTGEDVPDTDAAGLARLLILPFEPPGSSRQRSAVSSQPSAVSARASIAGTQSAIANPQSAIEDDRLTALGLAQAMAADLPAVGAAWLDWLEGEGAEVAAEAGARFPTLRARWLQKLRGMQSDMVNPLRVASSLACNEVTWWALHRHPRLGALAARFDEHHAAGILLAAGDAAGRTVVSLEAARFLAVLRELLVSRRCELIAKGGGRTPVENDAVSGGSLRRAAVPGDRPDRSPQTFQVYPPADGRPGGGRNTPQESDAGGLLPERILGWECPDGSIHLLPELARREVERVLGPGGLNGISSRTLHEQLSELGLIASRDPGRFTRKVREAGRTHNVLHLLPGALEG